MPETYPYAGAQTRLVTEDEYGVTPASPVFFQLAAMGLVLSPVIETDEFAPPGYLIPSILLPNDDYATADAEGRLGYNDLPFVFSSLMGVPTINDLGGGAIEWIWGPWDGRTPLNPVSYTVDSGYPDSAERMTGFTFNDLTISGGRSDGFDVSSSGFGKSLVARSVLGGLTLERQTISVTGTVSGGTYTITWNGQTTAPLAHNANAATIQTALEALGFIKPGDVVVGGGALPTTPATVDFTGRYAGVNVSQMTINSGSLTGGGSYSVATTTPGADAVVNIAPVPAGALQGNLYLDTSWANLGMTKLKYGFNAEFSMGERMQRGRPINRDRDSDFLIDTTNQEHTFAIALGKNAVEQLQLDRLRQGIQVFPRFEWIGNEIASSGEDFTLQIDMCGPWREVGGLEDTDGAATREYTGRIMPDGTTGNALQIRMICETDSLNPS